MGSLVKAAGGTGAGIGGIAGGIIGNDMSSGARGQANDAANISNQILQALQNAPDISKPLILQQYKQQGILTPEMEANITAQVPAAIGQDSQAVGAQRQALSQMQQRAAGGLSAGDRAALQESGLAAQGDVTSRLASIQQQAQQQGTADSGTSLAAQLSAAQGGANRQSSNANQIAQQAQQAAIQATGQAASLGSNLEGQNFGEQAQQQAAQQQMQRFNIQNQIGIQHQNVGTSNQAQAGNLANAQQLANANVGQANQEQRDQLQRQMQQFGANTGIAQIKAGGMGALSQQKQALGNQQAAAGQAIGSGIGGMLGAGAAAGGSSGGAGGAADDASDAALWKGGSTDFTAGGHVPGQAIMPGDHPANDTVDAKLSPGEIVIPRTVAKSPLGKKLLKLLEDHHSVQNELDKHNG
jgi:hypothetical protein